MTFQPLRHYSAIYLCIFMLISFQSAANDLFENQADLTLRKLYHTLNSKLTISARVEKVSAAFLNKPYLLGALGEGSSAIFDQFPRYRIDGFDCETYVTTVLAIALAPNLHEF